MLHCEKCGAEANFMVQALIAAPGKYYHALSKRVFRYKEVQVYGVHWETADIICPSCGHVENGYGNYVTRLKDACESLKVENANLRKLLEEKNVAV